MNIYIGNLPYTMSDKELESLFAQFGNVTSAKVIMDKVSGKSKGFGFIDMPSDDEAQRAIDELNGTQVGGRSILVNKARDPQPRQSRPSFRGPRYN